MFDMTEADTDGVVFNPVDIDEELSDTLIDALQDDLECTSGAELAPGSQQTVDRETNQRGQGRRNYPPPPNWSITAHNLQQVSILAQFEICEKRGCSIFNHCSTRRTQECFSRWQRGWQEYRSLQVCVTQSGWAGSQPSRNQMVASEALWHGPCLNTPERD